MIELGWWFLNPQFLYISCAVTYGHAKQEGFESFNQQKSRNSPATQI